MSLAYAMATDYWSCMFLLPNKVFLAPSLSVRPVQATDKTTSVSV